MIQNLNQELMIMDTYDVEPNYAELGRKYQMDYRTVKKYHKGYSGKSTKRRSTSILDNHYDDIKLKLELPGAKVKSTYHFFKKKYDNIGKYGNFLRFVNKHDLKPKKTNIKCHPRFETPLGKQLQFDWKEDVKITNKKGVTFKFNVFTAVLCTSRLHIFIYSKFRTREDVERSLLKVFEYICGVPEEVLTDSMTSIVNSHNKRFVSEFIQFCKDMGCIPKKCKIKSPETKGKDESSNRFINWLVPYNNEFETEEELINILSEITRDVNQEINDTTGVAPIMLYQKEKEYLKPLPNKRVRDSYLNDSKQILIEEDFLVYYRGSRYSVPPKFINKKITYKEIDNKLHLYYNNNLIIIHEIKKQKINYDPSHYIEGLKETMPYKSDDDIEKIALENLKLFDYIGSNEKGEKINNDKQI